MKREPLMTSSVQLLGSHLKIINKKMVGSKSSQEMWRHGPVLRADGVGAVAPAHLREVAGAGRRRFRTQTCRAVTRLFLGELWTGRRSLGGSTSL